MYMKTTELDDFTRAYIECALWSSTDDDSEPLDSNYSIEDIAPDSLQKMIADCQAFQKQNAGLLLPFDATSTGYDFWLTRNGHGCGFWDGDYPEEYGDPLTEACKEIGECDLYVGDDGQIYVS